MMKMKGCWIFLAFVILVQIPVFSDEATDKASSEESEREQYLRQFAKDKNAVKPDLAPKQPDPIEKEDTRKLPGHGSLQVRDIETKPATTSTSEKIRVIQKSNADPLLDEELDVQGSVPKIDPNKAQEMLQKLSNQSDGTLSKEQLEDMKKVLSGNVDLTKADSSGTTDYGTLVYTMLDPFRKLDEAQVATLLAEKFSKSPLGFLFKYQKFSTTLAKIVRDEKALPELVRIGNQRSKLYTYGGFVLATFVFGFILKRLLERIPAETSGAHFRRFIFRLVFINGLRFGGFIVLFQKNLAPAFSLFFKNII